jgi:hypothetical protein
MQLCRDVTKDKNLGIAYSLTEQGRYREAIGYWKFVIDARLGVLLRFDSDPISKSCLGDSLFLYTGGETEYLHGMAVPASDFYQLNLNWYYYQAKLNGGDRDFGPWLHSTYLCALLNKVRYKYSRNESGDKGKVMIELLDGRKSEMRNDPGWDNYSDEIPPQYVAAVRQHLGETEAAMAQRFIDEIFKPLHLAEEQARKTSSNESILQQQDKLQDARLNAALAALYDKATTAAKNRNFPPVYVQMLEDTTKSLIWTTKSRVEYKDR